MPAEAGWQAGTPLISVVATDRKIALGMRRGCAVCGRPMPPGTPVYRAFAQVDAAQMRMHERERSQDLGGPLHLSCSLYSAMACPYLRERTSRLGKDSAINPGARRGTRAAIMGFRNFGMMLYAAPHHFLDPATPPPHFAYIDLVDDIPYCDGAELAGQYEVAVSRDAETIDMSKPSLYWRDGRRDEKRLGAALRSDFQKLDRSTPSYDQIILGLGRYVVFPL